MSADKEWQQQRQQRSSAWQAMSKTPVTLSLWQTFQKNNAHTHRYWSELLQASDSVVPAVKKWKHHLIMHAIFFFFSVYLSLQTFNVCQYTLQSARVPGHIGVKFRRIIQIKYWNSYFKSVFSGMDKTYDFVPTLYCRCFEPDTDLHKSRCLSDM